ncbi:hypothetical protein [Nocardia asteroides]|uniref:hypothetical protein n=1 Tax=Nocardia asteroides TaxID=1824 RepID=UPI001E556FEB|nr:hypothetical protein [Nocardia asteroides]UGT60343.1 hypothetical protein LTT61_24555 [Nocardia asteroides]
MTRSLGSGLGLNEDAVADFELVAHELAAALIPGAARDADVRYEYREEAAGIRAVITSHATAASVLHGLGWRLVRSLVTDLAQGCGSFDRARAGHPVTVGFSWPHPQE